jgi:spermidine synthase
VTAAKKKRAATPAPAKKPAVPVATPQTAAAPPAAPKAPFRLLLAGVFLAGAGSLVYEVVWVRELAYSLGSTALAASTMLAAFLGGLALGSWLVSRGVDEHPDPARGLIRVEIGAAVIGAVSAPVLALAGHAYVLAAGGVGPAAATVLRALFSLVVMLAPATLFGMAFPLASSAAVRLAGPERAASGVYAASSFGSALGAAAAGLLLVPLLGITGAALVAAALNVLAAVAIWGAGASRGERADT